MLPLPKGAVWQALLILCMILLVQDVHSEGRVVCYYTNWSVYRPGTAKFNPQNINPYLCTHLIYAFGGFTKDNTLKPFDKYQDIEQGGYAKFTGLKSYNKQLKTMIAIGGWNEASSRFSPLVANPERRQQFIRNILKFLRQNHFDGLDLDWEYPAFRDGGKPRDRDNYAQFVEELRSEFDRESSKTGRPRLLLTMAVPAGIEYIEKGYDVPKLNRYLDWFNILSYDYHSAFEPSVNHHSPLFSLEEESEYNYDVELNIDYTVKFYLQAGADRDKLVLGIPTYGRSYTLINEDDTAMGAAADGPGEQGDATREKGYLAYYEICQNLRDDADWTVVQPNPKAMGPYAYLGNQWVGYDDEDIVRRKAEYVADNSLGGIMFWSIDNDDFRGTCTGKPYPLIEAAKEALLERLGLGDNEVAAPSRPKKPSRSRSRLGSSTRNKITEESTANKVSSTSVKQTSTRRKSNKKRTSPATTARTTAARRSTTTASSLYIGGRTTTPAPPTTPDPGADFKCEEEGFFSHPRDCKKYFWCLDSGPSNLGIVAHQFTCPSGLYFNTAADSCDFTRNVVCQQTTKTTTTAKTTITTTAATTTTSTTQSSKRITAATSKNSFLRFSSTTASSIIDDDEEYEDEDDEEEEVEDETPTHDKESEEDPRVIKELIDLIKRVGGLEELEKQLQLQEDGSIVMKNTKTDQISTTPSSISKSLYAKVLSRPNNLNALRGRLDVSKLGNFNTKKDETTSTTENEKGTSSDTKYSSINRNSRPSPQNAGIDKLPEFEGFLREKPKYVTINRSRPTKTADEADDADEAEEDDEENDENDESDIDEDVTESTQQRTTSSYINIRRSRPTKSVNKNQENVETEDSKDDEILNKGSSKSSYQSINRNRGASVFGSATEKSEKDISEINAVAKETSNPTTEDGNQTKNDNLKPLKSQISFHSFNRNKTSISGETLSEAESENKEDEAQIRLKSSYQSLSRSRSSTSSPSLDANDEKEHEASTQSKTKSSFSYQTFNRNRNTATSESRLSEAEGKEDEPETKIEAKPTHKSFTRTRSTVSPDLDENDEKQDITQARTKSNYQSFTKNRSTPEPSLTGDAENEDEAVVQLRTKSTYKSFTNNQGTAASKKEADSISTAEEENIGSQIQRKSTYEFSSRRGSSTTAPGPDEVEEQDDETPRSKSTYQSLSRTRGTTTFSVPDENSSGFISTMYRNQFYDRTQPTTIGTGQEEASSIKEVSTNQDDVISAITVQNLDSTQYTTTPSSTLEQETTARIYANIARISTTPAVPTITTIQPPSSIPSYTTISELQETETTSTSLHTLSNPSPSISSLKPISTSDEAPNSTLDSISSVLNGVPVTIPTTPSGLDTEEYVTTLKTHLESDLNLNMNEDDKVTTKTKTDLNDSEEKSVVIAELTNSNSNFESSLNKPTESSLSIVDSVSDLTVTKTTSTATTVSSFKTDNLTTKRFNTRRKTFSTTSTTTTELPEKEFSGSVSSPRPFGFPRRRTRPQSQTSTAEISLNNEPTSTSATTTTKIRSQLRPNERRPVLSVRRRLPSSSTASTLQDATSAVNTATRLDTSLATPQASSGITTSSNKKFNRNRIRPTSSSTNAGGYRNTSESPYSIDEANTPKIMVRRKFGRPINRRTTVTPSSSDNDENTTTAEAIRTTNPLFKRRFSSTTLTPTTPISFSSSDTDDDNDQEAGSSVQETKFANNRYNQIGENFEEEDIKLMNVIKTMSKAPPPFIDEEKTEIDVPREATVTRRIGLAKTTPIAMTSTIAPRRNIIRRPQKTTTTQATTSNPNNSQSNLRRRKPHKPEPFEKTNSRQFAGRTYRPVIDYDYYDDEDVRFVSKSNSQVKVVLHGRGIIECLDQGNFPHPLSCKKFISCAKMEIGGVVGWEYTCPKGLSYDPVGGICNWAAGLGCKE